MVNSAEFSWLLGCQTRPWMVAAGGSAGFTPDRLGQTMEEISRIGFAGFETNLACVPIDDPQPFAELTKAAGVELCGAHAGGRWWDERGAARAAELAAKADRLREAGCTRLVVSIERCPGHISDDELALLVGNLTRLGEAAGTAGVQVAVHNHAAEMAGGARAIAAIAERADPAVVSLGADLGWVAFAGADVIEFIERFRTHLTYLHLRDVVADASGNGFTEIGRGTLDYPKILRTLAAVGYRGWLVAESDPGPNWRGAGDPGESARHHFDALTGLLARA